MEKQQYTIDPRDWCDDGAGMYVYTDEALKMRVYLEYNEAPAGALPWVHMDADGWYIKAESLTYQGANDDCWYDALSATFRADYRLTHAGASSFFDEGGDLKPITLPDWLVDHMAYLVDEEADADADAWEWCNEHEGREYTSYDALKNDVWDWCARRYANGGKYPDRAELIIAIALANLYISYGRRIGDDAPKYRVSAA